ncbi:MAG: fibronectin type III domain-containing protein, partial [Candidatus Dormibacter sp.]
PDGVTATTSDGTTLTATVAGLTNGTAYTFTVVASNAAGNSLPSTASSSITAGAPAAPGSVTAVPGAAGAATVSWSVPNDSGSTIDHYTVTPFKNGVAQTPVDVPGATTTSITITGLTADPSYTFTVTATNARGPSPAGTSGAIAVS